MSTSTLAITDKIPSGRRTTCALCRRIKQVRLSSCLPLLYYTPVVLTEPFSSRNVMVVCPARDVSDVAFLVLWLNLLRGDPGLPRRLKDRRSNLF